MPASDNLIGPAERSRHEVLVVDDNPASRYATVRLLQSVGFRTREAATGAEALRQADESVSAMVLDVHLPDIDGFEVCRTLRLRSGPTRLPVLHLSAAYITDEDKVRGLDSGADAYLTHPVEPAVLVATVQALIRARMAEDAMRRSEAKFHAIYAKAPSGICLLDAEGRFIDANPALLRLLRRDLDSVVGKRLIDFAPAEWVARIGSYAAHSTWRGEFPLLDGAGAAFYIEWNVSPLAEGSVSMAVATDMSERVSIEKARLELLESEQAARREAERVSRLKDDLIAVLSHELRTPLNAILGWAHVLQRQGPSEQALRGLKAIERSGKAQARLISDILDVSSINLGKLHLALETSDPAELLHSSLETLRVPVEEKGMHVQVTAVGPFRPIRADPGRFLQIVVNLVTNATKFSKPGGTIDIALTQGEAGVRLSVADDGQGIDPEFLPHMFDRFSQGDAANKLYRGGLGLGLSIVKHLVQLHGGTVTASSPGIGLGARFDIDLPAQHKFDTDNQRTETDSMFGELGGDNLPANLLEGLNILVVDDDIECCAMLQIILAERGASVAIAHGYDEALQALATFRADILLSDIGMPGQDGYDLVREVRRTETAGCRVPAIALTAFARAQDAVQARDAGFDVHCAKPLRPIELIQLIAELSRSRGRPDSHAALSSA